MPNTHLIVGLGASAGGLEAFKTFFDGMPPDSGMGFVLIQHLAPDQKSLLAEILGRHTKMSVVTAADGMAVEPNHVFVIPPDATLTIKDGHLHLERPAPQRGHRYPVDAFFASLAEDQGERAVCIILAGGGSDGTLGLRLVKEQGGFTFAQSELDAQALPGMPSSANATGLVDFVMRVEDMPAKLLQHQRHLHAVEPRKGPDGAREDIKHYVEQICALVRSRTGHDFSQYKAATLLRRIQQRMQIVQVDAGADYVRLLRKDAHESQLLFRDLLINVTQFFRDTPSFEVLDKLVIPKLIAEGGADDLIRVWVPGCATGEEAYSVAILLREALIRAESNRKVLIFATDVDDDAVKVARGARFAATIAADVSRERLERWFIKEGEEYCPHKAIREMCIFSAHNLIKDPPFSRLDFISCRNLFIYLNGQLQVRLLDTFHYALRPGGYLFLGSSEGIAQRSRLFEALDKKHRIFRRKDAAAQLPSLATETSRPATTPSRQPDVFDRLDRQVLTQVAPACVVINQNDEIVRYFGQTGKYLEPSPGAASLYLFSLLRSELKGPARHLLGQVRESGHRQTQPHLSIPVNGSRQMLTLVVAPLVGLDADRDGGAVVAFHEEGSPIAGGFEDTPHTGSEAQQELQALRVQLSAANADLETANEELKSSNEEYQSVNEELQSTNEELETAKEELQSTNEELHTVNAELATKNEELSRSNSDLRNFFDSTDIASLFLDNALRIRTFTPSLADLINVRDIDRGRPVGDLTGHLLYDDLDADVRKVMRTLSAIEREVSTQDGTTFMMRIRPYRSIDNVIDGVVMTFVDLTGRRRAGAASEQLGPIIESAFHEFYICDAETLHFTSVNRGARDNLGYPIETMRTLTLSDITPALPVADFKKLLKPLMSGKLDQLDIKTKLLRKDGSDYAVEARLSRIIDPPLIVINAVDLTKRGAK